MNNCTQCLTQRETELALLIRQGFTDMQIAAQLGISYSTVCSYIRNIRNKTATRGENRIRLSNAIGAAL